MKWSLHTPEGTADRLCEETLAKQQATDTVMEVFRSFGYHRVETPTFEFYDVFETNAGNIDQQSMFKFFDAQGRILVLRPDLTTPVARMAATKLKDELLPLRLCYCGNAFRSAQGGSGAIQREFTQCGLELLGAGGAMADAEIVAATIQALSAAGLKNFQVDIGQVGFFKGLCAQAGLNETDTETLRALVDRKDSLAIEELLSSYPISDGLKRLCASLPSLFGGIEVIDGIDRSWLDAPAKDALDNLKEVYGILTDYGLEHAVSIDLGMVQDLNYYTGIIFKGFTHGVGFSVCGGGRYDALLGEFGANLQATGVAIGIDRLLSALLTQNNTIPAVSADTLIAYDKANRARGFRLGAYFRRDGMAVETYLGDDLTGAKAYAAAKDIGGIIAIEGETVRVIDLKNGTEQITTYEELAGGAAQ